ncbi:MAG: TIR domain-containing protein [Desulfobacterium sp.]|nr:TIR domain-containing protein [Desulfobacterium sp.]
MFQELCYRMFSCASQINMLRWNLYPILVTSSTWGIKKMNKSVESNYSAFISYSHKDKRVANWLFRKLDGYSVPKEFAGLGHKNLKMPDKLHMFRDREELPASADLSATIKTALENSNFLIVVCSPHAATSEWVNEEVLTFIRMGRKDRILGLIVGGTPHSERSGGSPEDECFPPALRVKIGPYGEQTGVPRDPFLPDKRKTADGPRLAWLKILAGLLGVKLGMLIDREQEKRRRKLITISAVSIILAAIFLVLSVVAMQAKGEAETALAKSQKTLARYYAEQARRETSAGRLDHAFICQSNALANDPEAVTTSSFLESFFRMRREIWRSVSKSLLVHSPFQFSEKGQKVAAVSAGRLQVWHLDSHEPVAIVTSDPYVTDSSFSFTLSPDGNHLAYSLPTGLGGGMALFDMVDGSTKHLLKNMNMDFLQLTPGPDARIMLGITADARLCLFDSRLGEIIDITTCNAVSSAFTPVLNTARTSIPPEVYRDWGDLRDWLSHFKLAVNDDSAVAASPDGKTVTWNFEKRARTTGLHRDHYQIREENERISESFDQDLPVLFDISPSGKYAVSLDTTSLDREAPSQSALFMVWNTSTGETEYLIPVPKMQEESSYKDISQEFSFSGALGDVVEVKALQLLEDKRLLLATDHMIFLSDGDAFKPLMTSLGTFDRTEAIMAVDGINTCLLTQQAPLGLELASPSYYLRQVSLEAGESQVGVAPTPLQGSLPEIAAFSPDSQLIAIAQDNGSVRLIRREDGGLERVFHLTEAGINSMAFSGDGKELLIGTRNSEAILYDQYKGTMVWRKRFDENLSPVHVAWSQSGDRFLCDFGSEIHVFDRSHKRIVTYNDTDTIASTFLQDGRILCCEINGNISILDGDSRTKLYEVEGVNVFDKATILPHPFKNEAFVALGDGNLLKVSQGADKQYWCEPAFLFDGVVHSMDWISNHELLVALNPRGPFPGGKKWGDTRIVRYNTVDGSTLLIAQTRNTNTVLAAHRTAREILLCAEDFSVKLLRASEGLSQALLDVKPASDRSGIELRGARIVPSLQSILINATLSTDSEAERYDNEYTLVDWNSHEIVCEESPLRFSDFEPKISLDGRFSLTAECDPDTEQPCSFILFDLTSKTVLKKVSPGFKVEDPSVVSAGFSIDGAAFWVQDPEKNSASVYGTGDKGLESVWHLAMERGGVIHLLGNDASWAVVRGESGYYTQWRDSGKKVPHGGAIDLLWFKEQLLISLNLKGEISIVDANSGNVVETFQTPANNGGRILVDNTRKLFIVLGVKGWSILYHDASGECRELFRSQHNAAWTLAESMKFGRDNILYWLERGEDHLFSSPRITLKKLDLNRLMETHVQMQQVDPQYLPVLAASLSGKRLVSNGFVAAEEYGKTDLSKNALTFLDFMAQGRRDAVARQAAMLPLPTDLLFSWNKKNDAMLMTETINLVSELLNAKCLKTLTPKEVKSKIDKLKAMSPMHSYLQMQKIEKKLNLFLNGDNVDLSKLTETLESVLDPLEKRLSEIEKEMLFFEDFDSPREQNSYNMDRKLQTHGNLMLAICQSNLGNPERVFQAIMGTYEFSISLLPIYDYYYKFFFDMGMYEEARKIASEKARSLISNIERLLVIEADSSAGWRSNGAYPQSKNLRAWRKDWGERIKVSRKLLSLQKDSPVLPCTVVLYVTPGDPAQVVGLQKYDIVLGTNGVLFDHPSEINMFAQQREFSLIVWRDKEIVEIDCPEGISGMRNIMLNPLCRTVLLVEDVLPGKQAEVLGIRPGDILTQSGDQAFLDPSSLRRLENSKEPFLVNVVRFDRTAQRTLQIDLTGDHAMWERETFEVSGIGSLGIRWNIIPLSDPFRDCDRELFSSFLCPTSVSHGGL